MFIPKVSRIIRGTPIGIRHPQYIFNGQQYIGHSINKSLTRENPTIWFSLSRMYEGRTIFTNQPSIATIATLSTPLERLENSSLTLPRALGSFKYGIVSNF